MADKFEGLDAPIPRTASRRSLAGAGGFRTGKKGKGTISRRDQIVEDRLARTRARLDAERPR
jgi:hypothetical protein